MSSQKSEYYKTLAELDGESKFEIVQSLQVAKQKFAVFETENSALCDLIRSFRSLLEPIKPVADLMRPLLDAHNAIRAYVEDRLKLAKSIAILPQNGWYLSMWFIDSLKISDLAAQFSQEPLLFESAVVTLFEETLIETIQGRLFDTFPKRAKIIEMIFSLHGNNNYIASIPLALTQADGFCKDVFFAIDKYDNKKPIGFFDLVRLDLLKKVKNSQMRLIFRRHRYSVF